MTSPTYHCVPKGSLSRRELASRFPGTYSLTIEHGNWLCRYVSNAPASAEGEAWLARAKAIENHPNSWCVLSQTDEPEELLFIWVCDGAVMESNRCTTMQLDSITLQRAGIVWLTDSQLSSFLPSGCKTDVVEPLSTEERMSWQLKKPMPKWPLALIFGALALSVVGGVTWNALKAPPPPPPPPILQAIVDPWQSYRDNLIRGVDARHVIQNAVAMGLYGSTMPPGWPLERIEFSENTLALKAKREPFGQPRIITKWLEMNPELSQNQLDIVIEDDLFVAAITRNQGLERWQGTITPVNDLVSALREVLIALQWNIELTPELTLFEPYKREMTVNKRNVSLKELDGVANIFTQLPVGITSLVMLPTGLPGYFNVTLMLTLHGNH